MATLRSVVNGTLLTATITGLNPYTNYDCYVTANTSVGEGSLSSVATARTDESSEYIICLQYIRLRPAGSLSCVRKSASVVCVISFHIPHFLC